MHASWKLVQLLLLLFLLPLALCAQHTFYIQYGLRFLGYPGQVYTTKYGPMREIFASKPLPGVKLEAGLRLPLLEGKQYLELGLAYSINPVNYIEFESSYTTPPPLTYHITQEHLTGVNYFVETAARFNKRIGKKKNWEIVAGLRFSVLYYDGRKRSYNLKEFRRENNGAGNFDYVGTTNFFDTYKDREFNCNLTGWPELGIRSWCLKDGQAGIQVHSGLSLSSIFTKKDKIIFYLFGISYIRRWNPTKKK